MNYTVIVAEDEELLLNIWYIRLKKQILIFR